VTAPPFRESEMPLARCSDASLTRTLRRAEEVKENRRVGVEIAYFGCADPYPFRLYFEWVGYRLWSLSELRISPLISDCPALCVKLSPPFQSHNTNQLFLFRLSPLAATRGGIIELYA